MMSTAPKWFIRNVSAVPWRQFPDHFGGGTPSSETVEHLRTLPFFLSIPDGSTIAVVVHGSPRSDMEFVEQKTHPSRVLREYLLLDHYDL